MLDLKDTATLMNEKLNELKSSLQDLSGSVNHRMYFGFTRSDDIEGLRSEIRAVKSVCLLRKFS